MIYHCCICNKEIDMDNDEFIVVKTFFDKDFAHRNCAKKKR